MPDRRELASLHERTFERADQLHDLGRCSLRARTAPLACTLRTEPRVSDPATEVSQRKQREENPATDASFDAGHAKSETQSVPGVSDSRGSRQRRGVGPRGV